MKISKQKLVVFCSLVGFIAVCSIGILISNTHTSIPVSVEDSTNQPQNEKND